MRNFAAGVPLKPSMQGKPTKGQDTRPLLALTARGPAWPSLFMMRRTISLTALLAAVLLSSAFGATASAATPDQILRDCARSETGYLTGSYTKGDLRRALGHVRGDLAEYTTCYDQIRYALAQRPRSSGGNENGGGDPGSGPGEELGGLPDSGTDTGTGTPGTSGTSDPEDEVVPGGPPADVTRSVTPQAGSNAPVNVGGAPITPGSIPEISRSGNELPSAMVIFLVLLGAGAVGAAATTIGRRVLARRRA